MGSVATLAQPKGAQDAQVARCSMSDSHMSPTAVPLPALLSATPTPAPQPSPRHKVLVEVKEWRGTFWDQGWRAQLVGLHWDASHNRVLETWKWTEGTDKDKDLAKGDDKKSENIS